MNNDSQFTTIGDEPVEARIVAWVLGEASAFEAAELERLCEERPELMIFKRRMAALHGLLAEAEKPLADESWKLPAEKRRAVEKILGEEQPIRLEMVKEKRIRRSGRSAFLAIAACVLFTLVVMQLQPWKQTSEAIIEVRPRMVGMSPLGSEMGETSGLGRMTPQFFGTEFEKIKSRNSLEKVVENLDLANRWDMDKEQAVEKLKKSIKTEKIPDTGLIKIQVRNSDKKAADQITREVAFAYKDYREQLDMQDAARQLVELNKAVRDQEDRVEERRKVLATIVRNKGIIYKGNDSSYGSNGMDEDQGARNALDTFHKMEQEKLQLESQITSLLKYDSDQLMTYASGLDLPDNVVKNLYPQYLETKRQLEKGRIEGKGENHPAVVAEAENLKAIKQQLDEGVVNLRATLGAQLDLANNRLKQVEAMKDDSRESAIKRGLNAQDYVDAKREFETDQQLLQTMKLKQVGETISRKIPSDSVVVHEVPGSEAKSAERASKALASYAPARTQRLETSLPKELIEGTPRPIVLPEQTPSSRSVAVHEETRMMERMERMVRSDSNQKPTAPSSSMAKVVTAGTLDRFAVPVPEVEVTTPSLDFGNADDFGTGWGEGKDKEKLVGGMEIVGGAKLELQSGLRSGDGAINRNIIDAIPNRPGLPAEAAAAGEEKMRATEEMPVLGSLFADRENRVVTEEVRYKIDDSDRRPAPSGEPNTAVDKAGNDYWDTSEAVAKGRASGTEYELQTGYKSEYLFRGRNLNGEADEAVTEALELRKAGKYDEARSILEGALSRAPGNQEAGDELAKLDDPLRTNPALTYEHTQNVDAVRRGLYVAEGNFNLGKFDDAKREYEDVLRKDPYNQAARRGVERIETAKSDHYRAAYDHTRAELLSQVDNAWELPDLTKLMEEIAASEEPYSTFSLNISDASFRIAQAAMDKGERPDPAGVKVEQFYNAVDYGDPAPAAGEPVSCTIEQTAHPVIPGRNLVRVALKTAAAGRSATQPLRLTLLVDQSGSMTRADRRAAMDTAMAGLGKLLTDNDIINVVGFSRTSRLVADGMKGDVAGKKLAELVNQSASEGGTNLETAIDLAAQMAQRRMLAGAQNRIVLFTDGAANLGDADPQRLAAKVEQLRQQGIAFDIAGIAADGLNDELLGELARKGNGRYYVVGKGAEEDFAKQLAGAFRPAAENVKVQVRFNPERVTRYKLIGFEKDRLKTEDFRNDAVDAAELAAEEAGVAIYQIEPNPNGSGEIGEVSVRFRDTASGEMVERGWTIPHDAAAPAIDRATASIQLAVLSMLAAEKLKGGPLGEAIDFKQFAEAQANVKHFFGNDARVAEMLRMVEMLK